MISYKKAMELLKSEEPVYYNGMFKRKVCGLVWRRDRNSLVCSAEVLDEDTSSISVVRLKDLDRCKDKAVDHMEVSNGLDHINGLYEALDQIRASFIYEDIDRVKDGYNKLMKKAILLDKEIGDFNEGLLNKKVIDVINANSLDEGLGYEEIEAESEKFDERLECFDEDLIDEL